MFDYTNVEIKFMNKFVSAIAVSSFIVIFLLSECSVKKAVRDNTTSSADAAPNRLTKPNSEENDDNGKRLLLGKWIILTATDSGYIYERCSLTSEDYIEVDSIDSKLVISVQDSFHGDQRFTVSNASLDSADRYLLRPSGQRAGEENDFIFYWVDEQKGIGYWKSDIYIDFSIDDNFIREEDKDNFPADTLPCVTLTMEEMKMIGGVWQPTNDNYFLSRPSLNELVEFKIDDEGDEGHVTVHNDSEEDDNLGYGFHYKKLFVAWSYYEAVLYYDIVEISENTLVLKDSQGTYTFERKE
jgi:hypothetical protein